MYPSTHKILTMWWPKQDMRTDNASFQASVDGRNVPRPPPWLKGSQ